MDFQVHGGKPAGQLFKSYRFDEAVKAYEQQLQQDPENMWPNLVGLAEALMACGSYADAIPIFEKVSEHERSE